MARSIRAVYRYVRDFSLPAPGWIFRPILAAFVFVREIYYFGFRVFICEPLLKRTAPSMDAMCIPARSFSGFEAVVS